MFVRECETEQLIAIPVDEYKELIECRTKLNAVHGMITNQHVCELKSSGHKAGSTPTSLLEVVSGYEENTSYFDYLRYSFVMNGGKMNAD